MYAAVLIVLVVAALIGLPDFAYWWRHAVRGRK